VIRTSHELQRELQLRFIDITRISHGSKSVSEISC
jgi:hypothetical protein